MTSWTKMAASKTGVSRRSILLSAVAASASAVTWPAFSADDSAQQPFSATDFLKSVGIGIHLGHRDTPYYSKFETVVELLQDLGIKYLRDDAVFSTNITRDDEFYQRVRKLVGMGYRFDLVCADPLNAYIFLPPRRLPDVYDWCDGGVEIFEGANEPNLITRPWANPAVSAEHQRALFAVLKGHAALRNVVLASPSYIQNNVPIAENLSDAVDWINIHPYPGMEHPETNGPGALTGFITGAQRVFGKKPVLVSETGYHTAVQTSGAFLPVSEPIKTRYLPRLLLWNFKNGVQRSYIYELMDSFNNGPTDPDSNFGLATFEGTRKASFLCVKQFLSLFDRRLANAKDTGQFRFDVSGNSQDLQTAAFRRSDGSHLVFAWLGVSGWDSTTRMPRPPVTRDVAVLLGPKPRRLQCRQFKDDGSLVAKEIKPSGEGFEINISDQLTAFEIDI
jgi:hypothetical protein